jgi:hypothetical protein
VLTFLLLLFGGILVAFTAMVVIAVVLFVGLLWVIAIAGVALMRLTAALALALAALLSQSSGPGRSNSDLLNGPPRPRNQDEC